MFLLEQLASQLSPISFYSQEFNHIYHNTLSTSEFCFIFSYLARDFLQFFSSWDYINLPALWGNDKRKRMENKKKLLNSATEVGRERCYQSYGHPMKPSGNWLEESKDADIHSCSTGQVLQLTAAEICGRQRYKSGQKGIIQISGE